MAMVLATTKKILLVENNEIDSRLILSVLEQAGFAVNVVSSAEQAVQILSESQPEAILTDLDLPKMDGFAMTRQLKEAPQTSHIPVIAITAYPDHYSSKMAQTLGFAAFFIKPINTRTFSHELAALLNPS